MKNRISVSNVANTEYDEAKALEALIKCTNEALEDECDRMDNDTNYHWTSQFTVNIAGRSIAFMTGGPQIQGLIEFIKNIADENLYSIDWVTGKVKGWNDHE